MIDGWANTLGKACAAGFFGKPLHPTQIRCTQGPRAAILDISAGSQAEAILKALAKSNAANLRQTIGWQYAKGPFVFLNGPLIRVEVSWPDGLERGTIPLEKINNKPAGDGRWVAGMLENGTTHLLQLSQDVPHYLFSGGSGGGKSTGMRSAVKQLSSDGTNQIILLDGKNGEGLRCVSHFPNMVGPIATDVHDMRAALQYAVGQMEYRYENEEHWPKFMDEQKRIVVVFDEFQEFTDEKTGDGAITELVRRLAVQARAAKIHLILGTQTPNLAMFGHTSTRKQISGRVAFWMESQKASSVALGVEDPSAHRLTGKGDGYALSPGCYARRVQFAWVDRDDLRKENGHAPMMSDWPVFDPEAMRPIEGFSIDELAIGLEIAAKGQGRPALEGAAKMGSHRAKNLLRNAKELWSRLESRGFDYVG